MNKCAVTQKIHSQQELEKTYNFDKWEQYMHRKLALQIVNEMSYEDLMNVFTMRMESLPSKTPVMADELNVRVELHPVHLIKKYGLKIFQGQGGSGRTTELLKFAAQNNCVFVCHSSGARNIRKIKSELNVQHVRVLTYSMLFREHRPNTTFVVDNWERFIDWFNRNYADQTLSFDITSRINAVSCFSHENVLFHFNIRVKHL